MDEDVIQAIVESDNDVLYAVMITAVLFGIVLLYNISANEYYKWNNSWDGKTNQTLENHQEASSNSVLGGKCSDMFYKTEALGVGIHNVSGLIGGTVDIKQIGDAVYHVNTNSGSMVISKSKVTDVKTFGSNDTQRSMSAEGIAQNLTLAFMTRYDSGL